MYIPELIVAEKLRCLGIGKKLIQYCIKLAKKKNCYRIRLESGTSRKNLINSIKVWDLNNQHDFFQGMCDDSQENMVF